MAILRSFFARLLSAFIPGLFLSIPALSAPTAPKPVIATDVQCTGCVGPQDIASNAVGSDEIAAGSVGDSELTAALLSRIEALENAAGQMKGALRVSANGQPIGFFLGQGIGSDSARPVYLARSDLGYQFAVMVTTFPYPAPEDLQLGHLSPYDLLFEAAGCTGSAFVRATSAGFLGNANGGGASSLAEHGVVFASPDGHRYVPKGSQPIYRQFQSELTGYNSTCTSWTPPAGPGGDTVPALPNDPAVTGVQNEPFAPPITLGN